MTDQNEVDERLATIHVATAWDRIGPDPDEYTTAGVWLAFADKGRNCNVCGEAITPRNRLAAIATIRSLEDPALHRVHYVCRECAPNERRALACGHAWAADRVDEVLAGQKGTKRTEI